MGVQEKGTYVAIFGVLAFVGGLIGNVASAAWQTDDRIEKKAQATAEVAGAEAARRVVRDEIGPVVGAAVAAAVGPLSERVVAHIAVDDERQRTTDERLRDVQRNQAGSPGR